jgi:hypothetical protein
MEEGKEVMADLMSNIYLNPEDYRIAPDLEISPSDYHKKMRDGKRVWPVTYNVYSNPLGIRLASFLSEQEAEAFVQNRCNPTELPAKVYGDICRCGQCGPAWDYVKTGDITFERCASCRMPMRHDVMLALNAPLTKDFNLDDFLEMF